METCTKLSADEMREMLTMLAERAIAKVIYTLARACDRGDIELALSCYHPGATEDHGGFEGPAEEFITRRGPMQIADTPNIPSMWHGVMNPLIEVRGTHAKAESLVFAWQRLARDDLVFDVPVVGRYLDEFAYRDGRWAITSRTVVSDASRVEVTTREYWDHFGKDRSRVHFGARNATDISYSHWEGVSCRDRTRRLSAD
jgi:hypothetical protein